MDEREIKISIVITSYNHRAYLVEAIESVLGQTRPPHEIIVADDMSSDGSQDTIRAYERRYPGLVRGLLQERNRGIPENRNAALKIVTGNYVGILDGDDCFLPHKLEAQVAALRQHPRATVAYGNFRVVDAQRRFLRLKWREPQPSGHVFSDIARGKTGLLRTLIADYRAVVDAGLMDVRFPRYDGLWLSIRLAATCEVAYVDDVLLDKRDHPTGDSKRWRTEDHMRDLAGMYRDLLPLLNAHATEQERACVLAAWQRILKPAIAP